MKREFIPYEQALALKELGFDEPCFGHFLEKKFYLKEYHKQGNGITLRPTFSQCFRWFREKYNLIFQINYLFNGNYQVVIQKNTHEYMELIQDLSHACIEEIPDNYSYEEAELECLIKLIEIVKNK